MLKSASNPEGIPLEAFDQIRAGVAADRSQFYEDLSAQFFGYNRPGAKESRGIRDAFWAQSMQAGFKGAYDCVKQFSESDFNDDLKKFDIPTLVIHGEDDQIVPLSVGGQRSSKLIKGAKLKVYPGAPHGLFATHRQQFNADILAFIRS